jgi:hypothetical protein
VTVQLEGAVIGPGKADGTNDPWDYDAADVSPEVWKALATALGAPAPVAAVASLYAGPLFSALAKPEPFGNVTILGPGVADGPYDLIGPEEFTQDTFTPAFVHPRAWEGVPLDEDVRLRVQLWDKDLVNDDVIGVATINVAQMRAALDAQQVYFVNVSTQTQSQIVFISISVRKDP